MMPMSSDLVPIVEPSSQDRLLALIQKKHPNYHPVVALADLAHDTSDDSLAFSCHKEVAKYVVTVDKVLEVKAKLPTRRVVVELFGDTEAREKADVPLLQDDGTTVLEAPDTGARHPEPTLVGRATVTEYGDASATVHSSGPVEDDEDPLRGMWSLADRFA